MSPGTGGKRMMGRGSGEERGKTRGKERVGLYRVPGIGVATVSYAGSVRLCAQAGQSRQREPSAETQDSREGKGLAQWNLRPNRS